MTDVRKVLGLNIESPFWNEAYELAKADPDLPEWLTENYILALRSELGLLPRSLDTVLNALPHVVKSKELCMLNKVIYHILDKRVSFCNAFSAFELPKAPEGEDSMAYDCALMFPIIAHLRKYRDTLLLRGVDEDVIRDTLFWIDFFIDVSTKEAGRPYLSLEYFKAYNVALYSDHLIIGRLRFEICPTSQDPARVLKNSEGKYAVLMDGVRLHKSGHILGTYSFTGEDGAYDANFTETEDEYIGHTVNEKTRLAEPSRTRLSKSEWTPVYTAGDTAIRVHIPYGSRLDKELISSSFTRAKELLPRCYPEYTFKSFILCCWMLSPKLRELLPSESNIISFQNRFVTYPAKSAATDAFLYLWGLEISSPDEISLTELEEDNTLRRGAKALALRGEFIHKFNGYMPF